MGMSAKHLFFILMVYGLTGFCVSTTIDFPKEPFLFVRHGKTDWNPDAIHQGPTNLMINSRGKEDAEKAAERLFNLIYCDNLSTPLQHSQNYYSDQLIIATRPEGSENKNSEEKPTQSKTDPSSDFCLSQEYVIISSALKRAVQTAEIIAEKLQQPLNIMPGLHERYYGDLKLLGNDAKEGVLPPDAESEESFQTRIYNSFANILKDDRFRGKQKIIISHSCVFKKLSLLLTGTQQTIDYGGIVLFIPTESADTWTAQRL